jgi:hypothetical protein
LIINYKTGEAYEDIYAPLSTVDTMLFNPKKKGNKVNIVKIIKEEFSTIMKGEPIV